MDRGATSATLPALLHRALERQLRRIDVRADAVPDLAAWRRLLDLVSGAYQGADDDRYTLERSIEISSAEMRELHDQLREQARRDTLTGMPNRLALFEQLGAAMGPSGTAGDGVAVLFIDLDGFKQVNDLLGHAAGDALLVQAAQRIRSSVRTQDVIGRLAGDEFIVVASSTATSAAAVSMGRRIGRALEQRFVIGEQTCFVSASVGVTTSHGREVGADQLIREADLAMYEAKRGVHGVVTYDERMQIVVDERAGLESRLRAALEHERLVLHYQPLVSLAAGAATGYEALIRWRGEDGKLIAPDRFIPLAQGSRLIVDIGDWVLHGACAQAAGWADGNATVSVNLGARELGQADALARVTDALKRSGLAPGRLVVELTESTLMSHQTLVAENLQALRRLGVGVAIDDFGTGYSSLSQLRRLPVSQLKIDQSFIAELDEDPVTRSVVEAIVTMAHAIGLTVVGEGVERRTQLDALRELGCDLAQGYLLGAPAPEPRRDPA